MSKQVAINKHQVAVDTHKENLRSFDLAIELQLFETWCDRCETSPRETLKRLIALVEEKLNDPGTSQAYKDIRAPFVEYGQYVLARRFPHG